MLKAKGGVIFVLQMSINTVLAKSDDSLQA